MARAIYSSAQILLLDDVLAALDVHTAKWIVEEAFKGELIRGRTILLVTHNLALTSPIADHVVALGKNGRVISQGTVSDVLKRDPTLRALVEKEQIEVEEHEIGQEKGTADDDVKKTAGKLVVPEEKAIGRVEWEAIMLYIRGFGGLFFWTFYLMLRWSVNLLSIGETLFIGYWTAQYELRPAGEVPALK